MRRVLIVAVEGCTLLVLSYVTRQLKQLEDRITGACQEAGPIKLIAKASEKFVLL